MQRFDNLWLSVLGRIEGRKRAGREVWFEATVLTHVMGELTLAAQFGNGPVIASNDSQSQPFLLPACSDMEICRWWEACRNSPESDWESREFPCQKYLVRPWVRYGKSEAACMETPELMPSLPQHLWCLSRPHPASMAMRGGHVVARAAILWAPQVTSTSTFPLPPCCFASEKRHLGGRSPNSEFFIIIFKVLNCKRLGRGRGRCIIVQ